MRYTQVLYLIKVSIIFAGIFRLLYKQLPRRYQRDTLNDMGRVFTNGPQDQGSIQGRVVPKTQKMKFDAALHNTQHYKVRIKGKVEQSREWSSTIPYT